VTPRIRPQRSQSTTGALIIVTRGHGIPICLVHAHAGAVPAAGIARRALSLWPEPFARPDFSRVVDPCCGCRLPATAQRRRCAVVESGRARAPTGVALCVKLNVDQLKATYVDRNKQTSISITE